MNVAEQAPGANRIGSRLAGILLVYVGVQAVLARYAGSDIAVQGIVAIMALLASATGAALVLRRQFAPQWQVFAFAGVLLVGVVVLGVVGFATECLVTEQCFR